MPGKDKSASKGCILLPRRIVDVPVMRVYMYIFISYNIYVNRKTVHQSVCLSVCLFGFGFTDSGPGFGA